ncbi:uncharacterized protein N7498_000901 [Penicillium cinerascens]|uniref:Uncharacterized protein n=1 Tax=Penicillium cinerascens TaxID=70096 RepID=A0A9W9NF71_9EURO|nr:uncharacterized protein N7498_000901 [Penicillium cinerascens]KAJ5218802.1 hypothetical protein N7498_000901 [Penicillium cinerascens]
MDLWPCGRLSAWDGDSSSFIPDPTISASTLARLVEQYPIADFGRIRTFSHTQTEEFMRWPFPAQARLPDLGVYLALKTLSVSERSSRYPVDFDWCGNIRVSRKPCGEPVIVQAYGLLWIAVWRRSIILCGEDLGTRHGWIIKPTPSSELEPAFYAGIILLPSDYQGRQYVEFLRLDYGRSANIQWNQQVTELNAHTDFTRGWDEKVLELTDAYTPRVQVMRTIPGFRVTAVNPIVDIDCSHAPVSRIPNHAALLNLPWQADSWSSHPRLDTWSFDPRLQRPFNPLPVQLITTRYDLNRIRHYRPYDDWLVLFAEIMCRVKPGPEQSAFQAVGKAIVHRRELAVFFPDSSGGSTMLYSKQRSLDGRGGMRILQFMETLNDAQQKVGKLGDTRFANILAHFLCAMQVPCLSIKPIPLATVRELAGYLSLSSSTFTYENFLAYLRSSLRHPRS